MDRNSDEEMADNIEIREGQNFLGCMPPQVSELDQSDSDDPDWVAVVQLWRDRNGSIWLVVDKREELFGKVLHTNLSGYTMESDFRACWSGKSIYSRTLSSNTKTLRVPRVYCTGPQQWEGQKPRARSRRNQPGKRH